MDVLSVVAQQIQTIHSAIANKATMSSNFFPSSQIPWANKLERLSLFCILPLLV
jgi:hypothetical protein